MADWTDCPNCGEQVRGDWTETGVVPRFTSDIHFLYDYCKGSFDSGAAVAFGLMGMAEAIRNRCTCLSLDELRAKRGPGGRTWDEACQHCKGYP